MPKKSFLPFQIVTKPYDYVYSSATNYADLENIIDVIKVDFLCKTK